jgi:microcystin-dependent protein
MNIADFQQGGGFPLETDTLAFMQTSYKLFNDLGAVVGDKTIIKGCILTGSTVSNGTIYLNGELLEFRGGIQQSKIIVHEDIVSMEFEVGGLPKEVYKTRYAKFGTGVDAINWSEFSRIDPIILMMQRLTELEKKTAVFQSDGGMLFWNKPANQIPAGWQEVEDWRGRMPVGLDTSKVEFDTLGKEGGEKEVTLTKSQIPAHKHTGNTTPNGSHTHSFQQEDPDGSGSDSGSENGISRFYTAYTGSSGNHTHSLNINNTGGGQAHNNLPPYRVVMFIEYIG